MEVETKRSNSNRVKVHSLLSVVSSKPTSEPGKFHELSAVDGAMDPYVIHLVLYYGSDPFVTGPMTSPLDNLRISLSEALNMYPTVVGRLARGGGGAPRGDSWRVKVSDAGVRMLHADVGVTLDEWLRSADADEERDLTAWEDMPQDPSFWSPYRIQISNFMCGGLAIGISCNHMQADITSISQLVNSWSKVHRGLKPISPVFQLPQSSIPQNDLFPSPFFVSEPYNNAGPTSKTDTVTMKFSSSAVEKALSSQVGKSCPEATPYDVLVALFWSSIARCIDDEGDVSKRSLSICVDARNRGGPTIPYSYFGNALHFSILSLDKGSLDEGRLGQVSSRVHRHVMEFKGEEFWSVMSRLERESKESFKVYDSMLTCVSMEHLVDGEKEGLMSGAVFNKEEKPVHASFNVRNFHGRGLIVIMPSPELGLARNVSVNSSREVIEKLCEDRAILDMEPTMIVSGKRC